MSKIVQLKAASRARAGKGASRAVRRTGLVPGVVYGDKQEPQLISLTYGDVLPHVETGRFLSTLVDLEVEGKTVRAIARDVQFEPVRDFIVHVDFLRLGKDARIEVIRARSLQGPGRVPRHQGRAARSTSCRTRWRSPARPT